jgi:DNA-binding LacI/PurR family transcriptional regulator
MLKVQKKTVVPIYRQVMSYIRSDIEKKAFKPGDQLPSEPELAELYDVSRITIRKVLSLLSNEGLVERRKGKGTFVSEPGRDKLPFALGIISFGYTFIESNEYDAAILKGIVKELDASVPLTTVYWREGLELGKLKNDFKGLFLLHPTDENFNDVKDILTENIPVVFLSSLPKGNYNLPKVSVDNYSGVSEAMDLLIRKGRRRIAFISGSAGKSSTMERLSAYKDALKSNGIKYDKKLVIHMPDSDVNDGFSAAGKLFKSSNKPDAVFASTDLMALGVMRAAKDIGLSVPKDISIVGFDDSRMAPFLDPPLTSVRSDTEKIGSEAAKIMLNLLHGRRAAPDIVLPSRLVIRKSS